MTAGGTPLATPRVEVGARQKNGLRIGTVVRYAYASSDDPLGTVRAHALAGGAAASYVVLSRSSLAVATGPRFELGVVAGSGEGANGQSTRALTMAAAWELELHVAVAGISLVGALEAGTLFRGVQLRADDRDVLHLSGPFVGLSLGAML